ncbi:MAG: ketopantoate reductase family protein [Nitrospinae bacterium]|nr:ketopantoate reductase family protein [Nitrospinota bacterium]
MVKVLVIGAGAGGVGLSSFLLQSGCSVTLVGRRDTVLALEEKGLDRIGIFGVLHSSPEAFDAFSNLREVSSGNYDFILICVKSFDTEEVGRQLHQLSKFEAAKMVLCQNGWGNAETFAKFFPQKNIFNARVITGFIRPEVNKVDVTVHAQPVHLGSLFDADLKDITPLAQALDKGGIPCAVTAEIAKDLWAKMLYNCSLNALGAILEVPYGSLGEKESTRKIMEGIVEEVFTVMQALNYETHWSSAQDYLKEFYGKFLPSTYEHESSMLQDLRAGKSTEIEAINGVIAAEGMKRKIEVPYNISVCNLIRFLQDKSIK